MPVGPEVFFAPDWTVRGESFAQETRWPAVGKTLMSRPISESRITCAVLEADPRDLVEALHIGDRYQGRALPRGALVVLGGRDSLAPQAGSMVIIFRAVSLSICTVR